MFILHFLLPSRGSLTFHTSQRFCSSCSLPSPFQYICFCFFTSPDRVFSCLSRFPQFRNVFVWSYEAWRYVRNVHGNDWFGHQCVRHQHWIWGIHVRHRHRRLVLWVSFYCNSFILRINTPNHLLLDRSPNIGPLISCWELGKFKYFWNKSFRTSKILTLLSAIFELVNFPTRYEWSKIRALSNNRWSGGILTLYLAIETLFLSSETTFTFSNREEISC